MRKLALPQRGRRFSGKTTIDICDKNGGIRSGTNAIVTHIKAQGGSVIEPNNEPTLFLTVKDADALSKRGNGAKVFAGSGQAGWALR